MQKSSLTFDAGDIVVVELPFTDLEGSKLRPALVLSNKTFNVNSQDIIVAKITGTRFSTIPQVELTNASLASGRLRKKSYVNVASIFTLEKRLVKKKIAQLKLSIIKEVFAKLRAILSA